jgi:hypothetical protein
MFDSIPATWAGCFTNAADVKELIPEVTLRQAAPGSLTRASRGPFVVQFFFLAEFLRNFSGYNLGKKQSSQRPIGDVILPPWAESPEEFVRINRAALESEHVSLNLHNWIDLIFGFKQQGPAAVEAANVFFHLTYGNIDLNSITDPQTKAAMLAQIEHFGQTPMQLFTAPHPRRQAREAILPPLLGLQLCVELKVTSPADIDNPLLFIEPFGDRVLTVGLDRILGIHRWKRTIEYVHTFELEKKTSNPRRVGVHFAVRAPAVSGSTARGRQRRLVRLRRWG